MVTTPSSSCSSRRARSPCRLFPHPPQPHPSIQNAPEITTPLSSANAATPAGPHGSASVLDPSNPSSTRQRLTFVECKSESLGRLRRSLFKHNAQTHRGGGRQAPAGTSSSPPLPPPNTACHSLYTPATWDFPFLQGHQPFSTSSCTQAGTLTSTPSPTLFSRPAHPALSAQISPRRSLHVPVFKTSSPPYSAALSSLYGAHLVCFSLAHPLASPIDTWTYASEGKP